MKTRQQKLDGYVGMMADEFHKKRERLIAKKARALTSTEEKQLLSDICREYYFANNRPITIRFGEFKSVFGSELQRRKKSREERISHLKFLRPVQEAGVAS